MGKNTESMTGFSARTLRLLKQRYRRRYGLDIGWVSTGGIWSGADPEMERLRNLPAVLEVRRLALLEAVRWGEPFIFSPVPGVFSWLVPVVDGEQLLGGLQGGEVLPEDAEEERGSATEWLMAAGADHGAAQKYASSLPVWLQATIGEAADFLYSEFYAMAGFQPTLLARHRANAMQQREIAEAIHLVKRGRGMGRRSVWDEEQRLLFLLRTGDRNGARKILNEVLASIFLRSPKVALIQARIIELIGYLVRAAVEDDPLLEPLVEEHVKWIETVIGAREFDAVCEATRRILDCYMDRVSPRSAHPGNARLQKVLSHLSANYMRTITLDELCEVAGLSRFHLSRLIHQATGHTIPQHIRQLRIREACRLLENTTTSYADIAYHLGFVDQSYFIKQFREVTGLTPKRYRERS